MIYILDLEKGTFQSCQTTTEALSVVLTLRERTDIVNAVKVIQVERNDQMTGQSFIQKNGFDNCPCIHGLLLHTNEQGEKEVYCKMHGRFQNIDLNECLDHCKYEDTLAVGDICTYSFGEENPSRATVEIARIVSKIRGVAEVKILDVQVDESGNGYFNYLLRSGKTMNASFRYLKKTK